MFLSCIYLLKNLFFKKDFGGCSIKQEEELNEIFIGDAKMHLLGETDNV